MSEKTDHVITVLSRRLAQVIELHRDAGPSQGYIGDGYGWIDHACSECGSFGEYGEPWPCATYRAVTGATA